MKFYVAKVVWYDETGPATDYLAFAAEDLIDAAAQVAECFNDDTVETMEITLVNGRNTQVYITEEIYNKILKEGVC